LFSVHYSHKNILPFINIGHFACYVIFLSKNVTFVGNQGTQNKGITNQ